MTEIDLSISHGNPAFRKTLSESPWIFIGGKGGVGKTTVAGALALALARLDESRREEGILLISDHCPDLRSESDSNAVITQKTFDLRSEFEEYAYLKLKSRTLAKLLAQSDLVLSLLRAAPSVADLINLGSQWHSLKSYKHVLVDMPSTGHGLTALKAPEQWLPFLGSGPLANDLKQVVDALKDPSKVAHVLVTLPEELPYQEFLELRAAIRSLSPGVPIFSVFNQIWPKPISRPEVCAQDPSLLAWTQRIEKQEFFLGEYQRMALHDLSSSSESFLQLPIVPRAPSEVWRMRELSHSLYKDGVKTK